MKTEIERLRYHREAYHYYAGGIESKFIKKWHLDVMNGYVKKICSYLREMKKLEELGKKLVNKPRRREMDFEAKKREGWKKYQEKKDIHNTLIEEALEEYKTLSKALDEQQDKETKEDELKKLEEELRQFIDDYTVSLHGTAGLPLYGENLKFLIKKSSTYELSVHQAKYVLSLLTSKDRQESTQPEPDTYKCDEKKVIVEDWERLCGCEKEAEAL